MIQFLIDVNLQVYFFFSAVHHYSIVKYKTTDGKPIFSGI